MQNWKGMVRLERRHYFKGKEPKIMNKTIYSHDMDYRKNLLWSASSLKNTTLEITENAFLYIIEKYANNQSSEV